MQEKVPDFTPGGDEWWMAVREDIKDLTRSGEDWRDTPIVICSRKYLKSRSKRMFIQEESGSRLDAYPYRMVEIIRARRLADVAGIEFDTKEQMDDMLPVFARLVIDEAGGT